MASSAPVPAFVVDSAKAGTAWAIDPGNVESAYVEVDVRTCQPLRFAKLDNRDLLGLISSLGADSRVVIEQIGHYGTGMPAGATVFDTCIWIGRFIQALIPVEAVLIKRATIKAYLCGSSKAKDSNVMQALVDRFAPCQPNHGKGTKAAPGFFYGFYKDVWQSFALAVYAVDAINKGRRVA